jgi:hypothetical protein
LKRRGPNADSCGTPKETAKVDEKSPEIQITAKPIFYIAISKPIHTKFIKQNRMWNKVKSTAKIKINRPNL